MKKDNLGCDEVVLPVEVFNQYGTAQKYVEALRAENVTLSESVTSQALLIASLKEDCEAGKRLLREQMALTTARTGEALFVAQQLSDTQRQNAELKESIVQKNSDISSWIERDFSNQRKIADLMQRVSKTETDNL